MTRGASLLLLALALHFGLAGCARAEPFELNGLWRGQFPASEGDEGVEVDFERNQAHFMLEGKRVQLQHLQVEQQESSVSLRLTSSSNARDQALFRGTFVDSVTLRGRYSNPSREEEFAMDLLRQQAAGLDVSPEHLTLPSGGFHYDPLITVRGDDGKPVWVNLRDELHATSSNEEVATVDGRVRLRTGRPGKATITIRSTADPKIQTHLELTVVDATVVEVQVAGMEEFELTKGETQHLEVTARLSTGEVIPHCEYSSDLDVLTGDEFAVLVDGLGLVALRPCPPGTPITIGFSRGGATAKGRLWVRESGLSHVEISLGGKVAERDNELLMPSGARAVLEVIGTFHDGWTRPLVEGREYTVSLPGDNGYKFHRAGATNGYLTQATAGRSAELAIDLRESLEGKQHRLDGRDLTARVTTVEGTELGELSVDFAHYPDDHRLLAPGYARELSVLANFAALAGYRVSAFDFPLLVGNEGRLDVSARGWPSLSGGVEGETRRLELRWKNGSAQLAGITVVNPRRLEVTPWGEPLWLELGGSLTWRTLVDYGDGRGPLDRAQDYPVMESGFDQTDGVWSCWQPDAMLYVFQRPYMFEMQARDAQRRPLQPVGPNAHTTVTVDCTRQSDPEPRP